MNAESLGIRERDRARVAPLLGLAIGDALCAPREFAPSVAPPFPHLARGPITEMIGGGPFRLAPGATTDDTAMATCIAASLAELGDYVADDVARRYLAWEAVTFDAGALTRAAIAKIRRGVSPSRAGREAWLETNRSSAGNGSLMRCTPLAVFFAKDATRRRLALIADSEITHADPRCILACAAHGAAIAEALPSTRGASAEGMWRAARAELDEAARVLVAKRPEDSSDIERARLALSLDLVLARRDDPRLDGNEVNLWRTQGFVRVAFRLSWWELLHARSLEAALVDVAARAGDADTNGAITGALLGALHGFEGLPARWLDVVMAALQDGPPSPFRDTYHPKVFVALAGGHR